MRTVVVLVSCEKRFNSGNSANSELVAIVDNGFGKPGFGLRKFFRLASVMFVAPSVAASNIAAEYLLFSGLSFSFSTRGFGNPSIFRAFNDPLIAVVHPFLVSDFVDGSPLVSNFHSSSTSKSDHSSFLGFHLAGTLGFTCSSSCSLTRRMFCSLFSTPLRC